MESPGSPPVPVRRSRRLLMAEALCDAPGTYVLQS